MLSLQVCRTVPPRPRIASQSPVPSTHPRVSPPGRAEVGRNRIVHAVDVIVLQRAPAVPLAPCTLDRHPGWGNAGALAIALIGEQTPAGIGAPPDLQARRVCAWCERLSVSRELAH